MAKPASWSFRFVCSEVIKTRGRQPTWDRDDCTEWLAGGGSLLQRPPTRRNIYAEAASLFSRHAM